MHHADKHGFGGVFIREMLTPDAGTLIPQHSHETGHISYVAAGAVRAWRDGELLGDFAAPAAIQVAVHVKHSFLVLVPYTLVLCVHAVAEGEDVAIHEEHHFPDARPATASVQ